MNKRFFAVSVLTTADEKVTMEFFDNYTDAYKAYQDAASGFACLEEIKNNNEVQFMAGNKNLSIAFYTERFTDA